MKILVIGCGSIGQRHIKNLCFLKVGEVFVFDAQSDKLKEVKKISSSIKVDNDLSALWKEKPQVVFVSVPTSLHVKYAIEAAERGCHLFIEKPLSNSIEHIDRLMHIVKSARLITMVGCNMRFYWAIRKIKELLDSGVLGTIVSAKIEAGQYLPDWHPWEDYRKMYSAKKKTGGGAILEAIHEIDYAMWFFGNVKRIVSMYGKKSHLEIETEDVADILLDFDRGPIVNMHMDYIQRSYSRSCKIIGESGTINWDIQEHRVGLYAANLKKWKYFQEPDRYSLNQMYIDEIQYFLKCIKKKEDSFNNVQNASKTLKVALRAKRRIDR